jgi:hypothetical protein
MFIDIDRFIEMRSFELLSCAASSPGYGPAAFAVDDVAHPTPSLMARWAIIKVMTWSHS